MLMCKVCRVVSSLMDMTPFFTDFVCRCGVLCVGVILTLHPTRIGTENHYFQ